MGSHHCVCSVSNIMVNHNPGPAQISFRLYDHVHCKQATITSADGNSIQRDFPIVSLGLPLGLEAPDMMPNGVIFLCHFTFTCMAMFWTLKTHSQA